MDANEVIRQELVSMEVARLSEPWFQQIKQEYAIQKTD